MSKTLTKGRAFILWATLPCLGIGVASMLWIILSERSWLVWQLAIITAIVGAVVAIAGHTFEKRRLRVSAVMTIILALASYLMLVGLYVLQSFDHGDWYFERLYKLFQALLYAGVPAVAMVRLLHYPTRRLAGIAGLVLSGGVFAFIVMGIISYDTYRHNRLEDMGYWLGPYLLIIVANMVGVTSRSILNWRWIGVIFTLIAYAFCVKAIFSPQPSDWPLDLTWFTVASVVLGYTNVAFRTSLEPAWRWMRWVGIALITVTGALVIRSVTLSSFGESETRVINIVGTLALGVSLAIYLIKRMYRKPVRIVAPASLIPTINATCPACQCNQNLSVGDSACQRCGLLFSIQVIEPRCLNCGYLLYRIDSAQCPECGAARQLTVADHAR